MGDNVILPGIGDVMATARVAGVHYQKLLLSTYDSPALDAFGRWRVSNPATIFDSKLLAADDAPLFWDESLESGGGITASTPTAAKPYIDFTSTVSTAGVFTRQTFRRFNYQPGKGQMVLITGVLDLSGGGTGVERRIGYFDDNDGLFFEDNAGTIGVTVRSNDSDTPVDTTVAQSNWNIDNMTGTGGATNPSGITADWTKSQIFVIDFQWLAVGRVRFGIEVGGVLHYVHETSQANVSAIPYMSTPNLPIRYQMITTGASPASTMRCICSAVISEGGSDVFSLTHSHATTDHVNANAADTLYALLGIQLKTSALGATVTPILISILAETLDSYEWCLVYDPVVAGTFVYSDKANSAVQIATGDTANPSTNTVSGGVILARGFGTGNSDTDADLGTVKSLGAAIDGTRTTIVLAVRPLGSNADLQGALTWRETF